MTKSRSRSGSSKGGGRSNSGRSKSGSAGGVRKKTSGAPTPRSSATNKRPPLGREVQADAYKIVHEDVSGRCVPLDNDASGDDVAFANFYPCVTHEGVHDLVLCKENGTLYLPSKALIRKHLNGRTGHRPHSGMPKNNRVVEICDNNDYEVTVAYWPDEFYSWWTVQREAATKRRKSQASKKHAIGIVGGRSKDSKKSKDSMDVDDDDGADLDEMPVEATANSNAPAKDVGRTKRHAKRPAKRSRDGQRHPGIVGESTASLADTGAMHSLFDECCPSEEDEENRASPAKRRKTKKKKKRSDLSKEHVRATLHNLPELATLSDWMRSYEEIYDDDGCLPTAGTDTVRGMEFKLDTLHHLFGGTAHANDVPMMSNAQAFETMWMASELLFADPRARVRSMNRKQARRSGGVAATSQ